MMDNSINLFMSLNLIVSVFMFIVTLIIAVATWSYSRNVKKAFLFDMVFKLRQAGLVHDSGAPSDAPDFDKHFIATLSKVFPRDVKNVDTLIRMVKKNKS